MFVDPDGHPWEVAHNPHWTLTPDGGVTNYLNPATVEVPTDRMQPFGNAPRNVARGTPFYQSENHARVFFAETGSERGLLVVLGHIREAHRHVQLLRDRVVGYVPACPLRRNDVAFLIQDGGTRGHRPLAAPVRDVAVDVGC